MKHLDSHPHIVQDIKAKSLSYYFTKQPSFIDRVILDQMKMIAASRCENIRLSLHSSSEADLHDMVIYQHRSSYVQPHKHYAKSETYHLIEGTASLFIFNDSGQILKRFIMSQQDNFICRVERSYYHTLIPTSDYVIYHESRPGPFIRDTDSVYSPWSPSSIDKDKVNEYIHMLLSSESV